MSAAKDNASKIKTLYDAIRQYNAAYRTGNKIISDAEYDALVSELRKLAPDHQWFKKIEPAPVKPSRKRTLPIPMRSLDKAKNISQIRNWISKTGLESDDLVVIMPKYDGISLLVEKDGTAYSRGGDENEGMDCSAHYKMVEEDAPEFRYTYGELVFSTLKWTRNFSGRFSDNGTVYRSPRNTVAGFINRDEPPKELASVDFYKYGCGLEEMSWRYGHYSYFLADVCERYKQMPLYKVMTAKELYDGEEALTELYEEWSKHYYIDGVVIYVNELSKWESLGRRESDGNPVYAIAYKHSGFTEVYSTTVKDVFWNITKSGFFKPIVHIETVDVGDCEIDCPTGNNARFIFGHNIAKGAAISITRSGGVIPKIVSIDKPASPEEMQNMRNKMSTCPHCGGRVVWNSTRTDMLCENKECPGIRFCKITHFFKCMGVEGVGPLTYARLFSAGYDTVGKILSLNANELSELNGIGRVQAAAMAKKAEEIKKGTELETLLYASDCFDSIGPESARKLLTTLSGPVVAAFVARRYAPATSGIDFNAQPRIIKNFMLGVKDFYDFLSETGIEVVYNSQVKGIDKYGPFSGKNFIFSGFRNRKLEEMIVMAGGEVCRTMGRKIHYLVTQDLMSESSKIQKAKEYGVKIITPDGLEQLYQSLYKG